MLRPFDSRQFDAEPLSKVGEDRRRSTATSKIVPVRAVTSFSWGCSIW